MSASFDLSKCSAHIVSPKPNKFDHWIPCMKSFRIRLGQHRYIQLIKHCKTFQPVWFPIILWLIFSMNENTCRYLHDTWREILNQLHTQQYASFSFQNKRNKNLTLKLTTLHIADMVGVLPSITLFNWWLVFWWMISFDSFSGWLHGSAAPRFHESMINRKSICELFLFVWIWIYSAENVISYAGTIKIYII